MTSKAWLAQRGIKVTDKAQGLGEYALIVFLISVAVNAAFIFLSDKFRSEFDFLITTLCNLDMAKKWFVLFIQVAENHINNINFYLYGSLINMPAENSIHTVCHGTAHSSDLNK